MPAIYSPEWYEAMLKLAKQINPNLLVTYATLVNSTEEQLLTVEYQLTPGIRVIGIREEDGSLGLDFFFEHRFR